MVTELWGPTPKPEVLAWLDAQTVETMYLSEITVAELRFGLATMPEGKRRAVYQHRLEREVLHIFKSRILPFDLDASQVCSALMARAQSEGKAFSKAAGFLAATACVHSLKVATHDVAPFQAARLTVINPWDFLPI